MIYACRQLSRTSSAHCHHYHSSRSFGKQEYHHQTWTHSPPSATSQSEASWRRSVRLRLQLQLQLPLPVRLRLQLPLPRLRLQLPLPRRNCHHVKHTDYIQSARSQGIPSVTFPDRKPLLDYLTGKISFSVHVLICSGQRPLKDREGLLDCKWRNFYGVLTSATKKCEKCIPLFKIQRRKKKLELSSEPPKRQRIEQEEAGVQRLCKHAGGLIR